MVAPFLVRVVDVVPVPNGRVVVFDPSECRVMEPEPNGLVVLLLVAPFLVRVVDVVPVPNGRVVVFDPSECRVIEPEPNGLVKLVMASPVLRGSAAITRPKSAIKTAMRIGVSFFII